jgi:hypothetical protein
LFAFPQDFSLFLSPTVSHKLLTDASKKLLTDESKQLLTDASLKLLADASHKLLTECSYPSSTSLSPVYLPACLPYYFYLPICSSMIQDSI